MNDTTWRIPRCWWMPTVEMVVTTTAMVAVVIFTWSLPEWQGMLTIAAVGVVGWLWGRLFGPRHAHCDVCERCSLDDRIPACRRNAARISALRRGGWLVGDSTTCCRVCAPEVLRIHAEMNRAAR